MITDDGELLALSVQPDRKILAAGVFCCSNSGFHLFKLIRYSPDGSIDTSFGTDGIVQTEIAYPATEILAMTFAPDGSIFAAGSINTGIVGFFLAHFEADGTLDLSFGRDGVVALTDIGRASLANAVAVQTDGKVVVAGQTARGRKPRWLFAVVRYNADGSPDQTFGRDGKVVTRFDDVHASAWAVTIDADGRAVAAGKAGGDIALARYLG